MAWEGGKSGIKYKAVGVSPDFHDAIRKLAALDKKKRKMYQILDDDVLPILNRKLEKLSAPRES